MWVPAAAVGDRGWVAGLIARTRVRYGAVGERVLGTLWWYSASAALVGPVVRTAVAGGPVADAGSMRVTVRPDGLIGDVEADAVTALPGPALRALLADGIAAVSAVSGAAPRALWAIAADSVGNQALWSGGGAAHAEAVAVAAGLLAPRYVSVGGRLVVRRASCCLVYEVEGEDKCVSCPRQTPAARAARLAAI